MKENIISDWDNFVGRKLQGMNYIDTYAYEYPILFFKNSQIQDDCFIIAGNADADKKNNRKLFDILDGNSFDDNEILSSKEISELEDGIYLATLKFFISKEYDYYYDRYYTKNSYELENIEQMTEIK